MGRIKREVHHPDYWEAYASKARHQLLREDHDCGVITVAMAAGISYEQAWSALNAVGRKPRRGTQLHIMVRAMDMLGFRMKEWSCKEKREFINGYPGAGKKLSNITSYHPRRYPDQFYGKTFIMASRTHVWCVRNGFVMDWAANTNLRVTDMFTVTQKEMKDGIPQ